MQILNVTNNVMSDPMTYVEWYGASAALGSIGSAGALYELGAQA